MTRVVFDGEADIRTNKTEQRNGLVAFVIANSGGLIKTRTGANILLLLVIVACFVLTIIFFNNAKSVPPASPSPSLINAPQPTKPL